MEEKIIQDGFERYLVVLMNDAPAIVNASSFVDVLAELRESGIDEDDVFSITKIDLIEEG